MADWEKIESYLANPEIQESNRVATEISEALAEEAERQNLDLLEQFRFYDIRPQEQDIAFAILDKFKKPIGIAKLCLRPSKSLRTGYLAIWLMDPPGRNTPSSRRRQRAVYAEALMLLSRVAYEECGLSEVWTYVSPSSLYLTRTLKEAGYKQREPREPIGPTEIKYLEYFKRLN